MSKNIKFSRLGGIGVPTASNFGRLNGVEGKYIPFSGNGLAIESKNTYPQVLADLSANAPTHGAAIQKKGILTVGKGINFDILPEGLTEFLMSVNDNDESINDILNKVSFDLVTFGGFSLSTSWNGDRTIREIKHIPFKNVRLGIPNEFGDIDYYIVSNDWDLNLDRALKREYKINKFNPELINEPKIEDDKPVFDDITSQNATQLIYYKTYSVASNGFYPLPDYIQCLDAALNEVHTGVAMNNSITNGINGAYIISTGETVLDDDSKQEVTDTLNSFITGPENAGGLLFLPADVKVDSLDAIPSDVYTEVNKEIRQRLITGHGIPSALVQYNFGSGFSNVADEMEVALAQFQATTIVRYQTQVIRVFNGILEYVTTEEFDLQIIPFSFDLNNNDEEVVDVEDSTSLTE